MTEWAARIGALRGWRRLGLAAVMGLALGFAHTPFGLWPLAFVAGPVLVVLWRGGAGFWTGWAAGAAFFALTLHWIVEPFLVDAARYGWMAPFALFLMAGGLALFWGGAFWLAGRYRSGGVPVLALTWAGAEALRGGIFTGFPWVLPAYIWIDTPVAQLSAIFGAYGLSLLTLLAMLGLAARPFKLTAPAIIVAIISVWVWGDLRMAAIAEAEGDATAKYVRIIQPNIPQAEKWDNAYVRRNFDRSLALSSTSPAKTDRPDIVIWPEVAVPFAIETAADARAEIANAADGAPVLLGSLAPSPISNRWRNALVALDGDGAPFARYDKSHLVPFGEYMPLGQIMEQLGVLAFAGRGLGMEAGAPPQAISLPGMPAFLPLICYEGVFPNEVRAGAATGADWIVLITNDAWFGGWAGPAQHLDNARMRAIETGLPVARAANTGISAMILPSGDVVEPLLLNTTGVVETTIPSAVSATLFLQYGWLPSLPVLIITIIAAFVTRPNKSSTNRA